jgi:hypothetical protein
LEYVAMLKWVAFERNQWLSVDEATIGAPYILNLNALVTLMDTSVLTGDPVLGGAVSSKVDVGIDVLLFITAAQVSEGDTRQTDLASALDYGQSGTL